MAVFTLDLSDDARAKLEACRVRCGARSQAAAMRILIEADADRAAMASYTAQVFNIPSTEVPRTKVKDL